MADKTLIINGQIFKSVDPSTAQTVTLPNGQIFKMPAAAGGGGPSVSWNGVTSYNWNGVTSFNWNGVT